MTAKQKWKHKLIIRINLGPQSCVRARKRERGWEKAMWSWLQNERGSKQKAIRERHNIFHISRLAKCIVWPKTLNSHSVERVASASIFSNFWKTFKRCSRQTPAMWCWKNARKQQETKTLRLPPLIGKVDDTRKSGNSCKNTLCIHKRCAQRATVGKQSCYLTK